MKLIVRTKGEWVHIRFNGTEKLILSLREIVVKLAEYQRHLTIKLVCAELGIKTV